MPVPNHLKEHPMSHEPRSVASESERLNRLESSLTRWKVAVLASVLAGSSPWVIGAARPAADAGDVRVTSLTLVSPDGLEHATLSLRAGAPVLSLREGSRHATLTLADGNTGLSCGAPEGATFAGVSTSGAYFNARGTDQATGVYAGVDVGGDAAFRAYGADMRVSAALESSAAGTPMLKLSDPTSGETKLPAPANK